MLAPGEKILWSGVPDLKGLFLKRQVLTALLFFVLIIVIVLLDEFYQINKYEFEEGLIAIDDIPFMLQNFFLELDLSTFFSTERYMMFGVFFILLAVIMYLKLIPIKKYFKEQVYAITNRRLLVLQDGRLMRYEGGEASFEPHDLVTVELHKRGRHYGDVIFARNSGQFRRKVVANNRDPVREAKLSIGFKVQKNSGELLKRVHDWQRDAGIQMDKQLAEFLQAKTKGGSASIEKIENSRIGLKMIAPVNWKVTVKKGDKSFDRSPQSRGGWKPLGESDDWNRVNIFGTAVYQLEVGFFPTNQHTTYKEQARGRLVDSSENFQFAGRKGFMFEIKRDMNSRFEPAGPIMTGIVFSVKTIVLQAAGREIVIVATYADEAAASTQVIKRMLESMRIECD